MSGFPGLAGLRGQSMSGRRDLITPTLNIYAPGSSTFVVAKTGWYRFVLWGAGGHGDAATGGGGGALVIAERSLAAGQRVSIAVGTPAPSGTVGDTTVTLPSGEVLTAGSGQIGTGGTATAGQLDTKVDGATTATGTGANAAGNTDYTGGVGGSVPTAPGGGGNAAGSPLPGGDGLVVVCQIRLK